MNKHACGIDFGTSNSAIAAAVAGELSLIPLENGKDTIPSAIFFDAEEPIINYGREAISEYAQGYPGRLMRSLKSVLGSDLIHERTQVGRKNLSFTNIITTFVKHMKMTAEAHVHSSLTHAVVGRPVYFVDNDSEADKNAENELRAIMEAQGFSAVSFEFEPIAAAKNYEKHLSHEELVLVFDIGGGTSDFTLMRLSPEGSKRQDRAGDILANSGIHIGGTDFDRDFSLEAVMPAMGLGGVQKDGLPIPSRFYHSLATWHLINSMYTQKNRLAFTDIHRQSACEERTSRMLETLTSQHGHALADSVEKAKIALTSSDSIEMALDYIEKNWRLSASLSQLDNAISDDLSRVMAVAQETVTTLGGARLEDVDTIFMTGGSTAIPDFERRVKQLFPAANISHADRFTSVAMGLGMTAMQRYG